MVNNAKTLKLKKTVNLKDYIKQKNELNKNYETYVQEAIRKGLKDIEEGRVKTEQEVHFELERKYNIT